jgi:hypothetical protein
MINLLNEIWRPIKGYEGFYEVSSEGRVKSLGRDFVSPVTGKVYRRRGGLIKPQHDCKRGYMKVMLRKGNIPKGFSVHRLVATAFLQNSENRREVNHLNGDKSDNRVQNLEWTSPSENRIHGYDRLQIKPYLKGRFGKNHHTSIKIRQVSLDGELVKIWDSAADVERAGIALASNISFCLRRGRGTSKGYKWEYA